MIGMKLKRQISKKLMDECSISNSTRDYHKKRFRGREKKCLINELLKPKQSCGDCTLSVNKFV